MVELWDFGEFALMLSLKLKTHGLVGDVHIIGTMGLFKISNLLFVGI